LAEKIGQMTQLSVAALSEPGSEEISPERLKEIIVEHHVGSIFNVWTSALSPEEWHEIVATIQEAALLESRLGIPILYGIDSVHGANYTYGATLFPHNLGLAATWDPALVEETTAVAAMETAACGITWMFAPVVDLGRQPLWSRFIESFGEDVVLVKRMAAAAAGGICSFSDRVAGCAKHFIGYGVPRSGKDRTAAVIPENELFDLYMPPFDAAVRGGIQAVMVNSGVLNGEAVHASKRVVSDLLRKELGFDGVIISDWDDVVKLVTVHHVAADEKEATYLAVEAGIDVSMAPTSLDFAKHLRALVEEGRVSVDRIDESVRRVLRMKHRLGLFDHPFPNADDIEVIGSESSLGLSYETAVRSITLLKNESNTLPVREGAKILVTGPAANSPAALHGPWSFTWQGADDDYYPDETRTLLEDLMVRFGSERVVHHEGVSWEGEVDADAAVLAARDVDLVVLCLGEAPSVEKPGDVDDLTLDAHQLEFAARLAEAGKPIVLVLMQDRPRTIHRIEPLCHAVLLAFRPGPEGGRALADLIAGVHNPSGKLPFTYPRHPNALITYDRLHSETVKQTEDSGEMPYDPQYEFGHGLSYTEFSYSELKVSPAKIEDDGTVGVTVRVTNVGTRTGREVVQVFVSDEVASLPPPVRRLKDFAVVELQPGASKVVRLRIPSVDLSFSGVDGKPRLEPGKFVVTVGGLSADFVLK